MDYSEILVADDVDTVFFWKAAKSNTLNKYRIRIYWVTWEKAIVIVTEISDNQNTKNHSDLKKIINFCDRIYDLVPQKIMWIEHYPVGDPADDDTYIQVLLLNTEVVRYEIDLKQLEVLIGKEIL